MSQGPIDTGPTIILAEDDPAHAELICRALKLVGRNCNVVRAENGEDVLTVLRKNTALRPKLILMDINMPKMDGLEALRELKSDPALAAIPVVMLTTSNANTDKLKSYAAHANGYVTKGNDFSAHKQDLQRICDFWLDTNQIPNGS